MYMKRLTSLLMLMLTWFGVSMQAQVTPLTNVPDGDYYIVCPAASNHFAYYDGTNAYLRRSSSAPTAATETGIFTLTQGTDANAGKYTIQCGGKYVVAGTSLKHSTTAGTNVKLVDGAEATDANKWWVLAQDASNANLIDIFPNQATITASTPAWNFASHHGGNANQAVGVYGAGDGNSQWALLSAMGVISLNFGSGNGNANTAEGIVNVFSGAWNNLTAKGNTRTDLVTWNGQKGAAETLTTNWSVTWSAGAVWKHTDNISENILKGYLDDDDENQAKVTFTNLPFTTGYDVYIYKAADSNAKFSTVSVTIGEQPYTYTTDETGTAYFGDAQWGQSQRATSALGTNVICIKGLTASSITIKGGKRSAGRGAIAAIQVVETGVSNVINVTEDEYDARYLTAPVYLKKEGDLTVKVASETAKNKYVDVTGVTGTVTYEVDRIVALKATLTATLDLIAEHVGTNLGQITTNDAYAAARALLDNADATVAELEAETAKAATEYYTINMPQAGVYYKINNKKYPTYYLTSSLQGKGIGETNIGVVRFEPVEGQTDQYYILVNGKYAGAVQQSTQISLSSDKANAKRYSFGLAQWNVVLKDTQSSNATYAYLHMDASYKIVGWTNTAEASHWAVTPLTDEEALQAMKTNLDNAIASLDGHLGTNPGQYVNPDNGSALASAKAVTNNAESTIQNITDSYNALDIYNTFVPFTPGYYRFRNGLETAGYMYSDGTALKWKALDSDDASMIWHVSAVNGNKLTLSNYGDGKIPQSSNFDVNISMGEDANSSIIYENFGLSQVKIKMNGAQGAYANENGTVKNYNTGANDRGTWFVERVDFIEDFESLGFTAADKLDIMEGATVKYPNEFAWPEYSLTPEGINTAIDALLAVENTLAAKQTFVESENGQLLLRYRTMLTNNPSWGTPSAFSFEMKAEYGTLILPFSVVRPADLEAFTCAGVEANGTTLTLWPMRGSLAYNTPYIIKGAVGAKYSLIGFDKGSRTTHTQGCLTGVLTEGGANVPSGSYVLAKYQGLLGFYQVADGATKVCPQNKCYFTAPAAEASAKAFFFTPSDVTGIDAIITEGEDKAEIYNVHGQRLNRLQKGLNIVNGRKVVVR